MIIRRTFTVEASLSTEKASEALDWLQKFFDYFHPTLSATVKLDGALVKPEHNDPLLD